MPIGRLHVVRQVEDCCQLRYRKSGRWCGPAAMRTVNVPVEGFQETIFWLPEPRALVPGDLLIGDGEGGIRTCPESWLRGYLPEEGARLAELREALQPLLALPVEHILASHWSPVIGGGEAALERALA